MHDALNMETVRGNLRRAMRQAGIGAKPLAKKAGVGETAVRDIIEGHSLNPKITTLSQIAEALGMALSEILTEAGVAVVGKIGAGGSIAFDEAAPLGTVPRPPDVSGELVGLEIVGDSMLPKFDPGDVVYISRNHDGVLADYIGCYCACRLVTGETYLKQLAKGSTPKTFTLRSLNAADIEEVELSWATPIRAILPKQARRFS